MNMRGFLLACIHGLRHEIAIKYVKTYEYVWLFVSACAYSHPSPREGKPHEGQNKCLGAPCSRPVSCATNPAPWVYYSGRAVPRPVGMLRIPLLHPVFGNLPIRWVWKGLRCSGCEPGRAVPPPCGHLDF